MSYPTPTFGWTRREALLGIPSLALFARELLASAPDPLFHAFGELPSPGRVHRVLAAGPPAAVLLCVLAPEKLLGWPSSLPAGALEWLPETVRSLPVLGRLAGRSSTLSLERLLALRPDLVLDVGTVDGTYLSAAERIHDQTGIPFLLLGGPLSRSAELLRLTGQALGVEARGEVLARAAAALLTPCEQAVRERPSVYLARGDDGLETALPGSVNAEALEAACGRNVAQAEGGNVGRVSREQILAWNPDWVVTQSEGFWKRAVTDPFWSALRAVREGRLRLAPAVPFGWLDGPPGVNRLFGVRWLGAQLGTVPPPADWLTWAEELHELFYQVRPGREALRNLLRLP